MRPGLVGVWGWGTGQGHEADEATYLLYMDAAIATAFSI